MKKMIFILLILAGAVCFAQENTSTIVLPTTFGETISLNVQINDFHYEITNAKFNNEISEDLIFLQACFVTAKNEYSFRMEQNGLSKIQR